VCAENCSSTAATSEINDELILLLFHHLSRQQHSFSANQLATAIALQIERKAAFCTAVMLVG
jgi:hypothetical protein